MTKVYLLHDGIYERVLSVHATMRGVNKAKKQHLDGEVVEQAKEWWERFGGQERFKTSITKDTLEEHIASERACVEESFWVEEMELQ